MNFDFNFLLPIFFAFFIAMMIARYAIFSAQRRELQAREERLRVLEQKVETILRHLNLDVSPSFSGTTSPPISPSQFASPGAVWSAPNAQLSTAANEEIGRLIRANRKIEAIKLYREHVKVDLKTAKETIDAMSKNL